MASKSKTPDPSTVNHAWEAHDSQAGWQDAVREDAEGNIIVEGQASIVDAIRKRRKRLEQNDYSQRNRRVVRDMIRYLYVLIDASRAMRQKDPVFPGGSRMDVTIQILQDFVSEYYDQNPLSHLGFVVLKNGEAEILTQLSGSSKAHKMALQSVAQMAAADPTGGGEFSLQNGIEVAGRSLGHQPRHGSREIVILCGALSTCDPGYILTETLPRLKSAHVRVSTMALSAEMHICRKLAIETNGVIGVSLDKTHFQDWLFGQCVPPPAYGGEGGQQEFCTDMVKMGFPTRTSDEIPFLVHASQDTTLLSRTAYTCPQCQAKLSELPADCAVCGLKLVLSPHLARSFHHLFPVAPFSEVSLAQSELRDAERRAAAHVTSSTSSLFRSGNVVLDSSLSIRPTTNCFACLRAFGYTGESSDAQTSSSNATNKGSNDETLRFQCPECQNYFCADCDAYMHESLHNCPGCLSS